MLGLRLDEPLEVGDVGRACSTRPSSAARGGRARRGGRTRGAPSRPSGSPGAGASSAAASPPAASPEALPGLPGGPQPGTIATRCTQSCRLASARSCGGSSRSTSRPASRSGRRRSSSAAQLGVSSSTVRSELAELEALGLLTHPHTSAGRVPTESGYRVYAGRARRLDRGTARSARRSTCRRCANELESALRPTTEMLSQATRLLALVSAPSLETATVRHVEVLAAAASLRDRRRDHVHRGRDEAASSSSTSPSTPVSSTGRARTSTEQVGGRRLGSSGVRRSSRTRRSLRVSARSSTACARSSSTRSRRAGRSSSSGERRGCSGDARGAELEACQHLLELLERRAAVLELLTDALDPLRTVVRVGPEVEGDQWHDVSLVGATYGLPSRSLGSVALLGPLRMDYEKAIRSVRAAAFELSRLVEDVYDDV